MGSSRVVTEQDRMEVIELLLAMGLPSMDDLVEANVVAVTGLRRHNPTIFSDVLKAMTPLYLTLTLTLTLGITPPFSAMYSKL